MSDEGVSVTSDEGTSVMSDEEVTMTMTLINENQRINVTFTNYRGLWSCWLCMCMYLCLYFVPV